MTTLNPINLCVVLTSIRTPTRQVGQFLRQPGWRTFFVADLKTPEIEPMVGLELISVDAQRQSPGRLALELPWCHYSRKNLGYVRAIQSGAEVIFDTDDDNAPLEPWVPRPAVGRLLEPVAGGKWLNVYQYFGGNHVWPRGYPLEEINAGAFPETAVTPDHGVMIWQGLVEGDPDVDAIFRLTRFDKVTFKSADPVVLPPGTYCPFNSQNTWWSRSSFPYLYLPSTVTFRFTDILRGLVAQRCLWAHGWRLGFQGVTARQERNAHDLMADFKDELPCYLLPNQIVKELDRLELGGDAAQNLKTCYSALADKGWVEAEELNLVDCWLADIS